ncbi:hypothetical protein L195_g013096, partial [Trifolium pratense]
NDGSMAWLTKLFGLGLLWPVIPPLLGEGGVRCSANMVHPPDQPDKPKLCSITLMPPLGLQVGATQLGKLTDVLDVYKESFVLYSRRCGIWK